MHAMVVIARKQPLASMDLPEPEPSPGEIRYLPVMDGGRLVSIVSVGAAAFRQALFVFPHQRRECNAEQ